MDKIHLKWPGKADSDKAIVEEIEKQTDRATALIATAYLEERLVMAIKARLNHHEEIENRLFKGAGPLASFSSKIDLGFLLGLYDPGEYQHLHIIREIRNEFAHKPEPRDFNFQRIFDLCKNINVQVNIDLRHEETKTDWNFKTVADGTPRTAFLNAVRLLLLHLDIETKKTPLRKPALPVMRGMPKGIKHAPLTKKS
jgi:hypothetical protein